MTLAAVTQQHDIVVLVLAAGAGAFALLSRERLSKMPAFPTIMFAYSFVIGACVLTVMQALIWPNMLDLLRHLCHGLSAALLAVWSWRAYAPDDKGTQCRRRRP